MSFLSSNTAARVSFVLTRIVVPLWILSGAVMKLLEGTPKLLPREIWTTAHSRGADLYWLLAILIGAGLQPDRARDTGHDAHREIRHLVL